VTVIHGPDSTCRKADWYDNLKPLTAVNTSRVRSVHDKRRKIWDMGFSQKALDAYEPRVLHYAEQLATALTASEGKPVNVSAWFSYLAFDIMSDLSFGKPFNMVRDGKSHYVRDLLVKGIMVLGPLTPVPWLFHLAGSLPRMTKDWLAYRAWVLVQLKERMQMEAEKSNVMSWLIKAGEDDDKWDMSWLEGDAVSMVVAGSEPEASTLVFLFYYLAKLPEKQAKLRAELESASFPTEARTLQSLPTLNGCIHEALRLHPPLPSGCLRITPSEGLNIDGRFIPGDSTVLTPAYSLGRLESCFENAKGFVPERWSERPEMLRDKTAWIPFNIGMLNFAPKWLRIAG
jgi:tryprostatin B 6-hydroxylase